MLVVRSLHLYITCSVGGHPLKQPSNLLQMVPGCFVLGMGVKVGWRSSLAAWFETLQCKEVLVSGDPEREKHNC